MRKIALLFAWLVLAAPLLAEDDEERRKDSPPYESPVLSLILLPVNVLIKIASVFGPQDGKTPREATRSEPPPK